MFTQYYQQFLLVESSPAVETITSSSNFINSSNNFNSTKKPFNPNKILHDWLFKIGSYKSHPQHKALYEALEASIDRDNREEFMDAMAKSRKRHRDDQDPPLPPPKDSEQSKKKRYDSEMEECHLLLKDKIDLTNPEGDKDKRHALSISKLKAVTTKPLGSKNSYRHCGLKVNMNTLLVQHTVSHTGGLSARNSTSQDTVPPLIIVADYKEYKISKADFKILHSNDFEDLYLLHLQGNLNHLSGVDKVHLFNAVNLLIRNLFIRKRVEDLQLEIESYQTKLNLTQPN
uniref:Uncharacterized protein n=1 Tax=Tanacetum cinerariifolium TaxID=118510 RepID=A0A699ITB2_TANCI|nr:hypothetical protein [Tanacetum cinerariifolium]